MLDQGFIDLQLVPTEFQLADPVTKGLEGTAPTYMLFRAMGEVPVAV
jgi:hypothetical protein